MASTAREGKRCAYCGSRDISAGKRAGLKLMLSSLTNVWTSTDGPEMAVHPKNRVACATCKATYTVQTIGNEDTRALLDTIGIHNTALVNFWSIFPGRDLGDLERSVTASVRPATDTLDIFLALDGKRAYLMCRRVAGRFAAVTVEETRG